MRQTRHWKKTSRRWWRPSSCIGKLQMVLHRLLKWNRSSYGDKWLWWCRSGWRFCEILCNLFLMCLIACCLIHIWTDCKVVQNSFHLPLHPRRVIFKTECHNCECTVYYNIIIKQNNSHQSLIASHVLEVCCWWFCNSLVSFLISSSIHQEQHALQKTLGFAPEAFAWESPNDPGCLSFQPGWSQHCSCHWLVYLGAKTGITIRKSRDIKSDYKYRKPCTNQAKATNPSCTVKLKESHLMLACYNS